MPYALAIKQRVRISVWPMMRKLHVRLHVALLWAFPRGKTHVLFCIVRPTICSVDRFDTPSTSTSNILPMSFWLLWADSLFCSSIILFSRSIFTFSGTLSGMVREASVPGRSEYLNMKEESILPPA